VYYIYLDKLQSHINDWRRGRKEKMQEMEEPVLSHD
jgi:hypothetical protein